MSCTASRHWSEEGWNLRAMTRGWRPLELVAMIGGFVIFWPVGLAILAWKGWKEGWWGARRRFEQGAAPGSSGTPAWDRWTRDHELRRDSGNSAFEDYKDSELKRLQAEFDRLVEEQRAFGDFLDSLRRAKDKEEFDAFLAQRRGPAGPAPSATGA